MMHLPYKILLTCCRFMVGNNGTSQGLPANQNTHGVACTAKPLQVWAPYLALHFIDGSNEQGTAAMGSLLELLLAVAAQHREEGPNSTRSAAAAAIRALTSAALNLGWDRLVQAVPGLLQVLPLALVHPWVACLN
jgi:hypothetical protein